jgi:DNA-binding transcriptional LysR family regulator
MELRHLRYFIAVAEHLNFTKAAVALGTAQPSLSQQIRQLEAEIGIDLFAREKRQIALTSAGADFLAEARVLLAQLEGAVARAQEAGRGLRGELRVAYTVSAMMWLLPAAIRAYRAGHPNVRITLRAMPLPNLLQALRAHEADIGVLFAQRDSRFAGIATRPIGQLALGAFLPQSHRLAKRRAFSIEEVGDEPLILFDRRLADVYDIIMALCRERGFVPASIEEVDRIETVFGLVAAGEGVSFVTQVYETLVFPGVVYRPLKPAPEPLALIVAQSNELLSATATAFAGTCARVAAEGSLV